MADDADTTEAEPAPEPQEMMHGVPVSHSCDQLVLHPSRDDYLDVIAAMSAEGYIMCIDVCGVDYLDSPHVLPDGVTPERFEVVVNLINHADATRARLRVQVPADDPTCPSLFATYAGCEAMEREAYDMFGITFDGHPDMSRILMPEDWDGHPLRKDYAVGQIPVQFKAAP